MIEPTGGFPEGKRSTTSSHNLSSSIRDRNDFITPSVTLRGLRTLVVAEDAVEKNDNGSSESHTQATPTPASVPQPKSFPCQQAALTGAVQPHTELPTGPTSFLPTNGEIIGIGIDWPALQNYDLPGSGQQVAATNSRETDEQLSPSQRQHRHQVTADSFSSFPNSSTTSILIASPPNAQHPPVLSRSPPPRRASAGPIRRRESGMDISGLLNPLQSTRMEYNPYANTFRRRPQRPTLPREALVVLPPLNHEQRGVREGFHSLRLSQDQAATHLTRRLVSILENSKSRRALCNLHGSQAQVMIEYLYKLLQQPSSTMPRLQKHILKALYRLSESTQLYPHHYVLKDIAIGDHESGGGFSDILRGRRGNQNVCLKAVRLYQKADTDALLKIYAKEAILWGQMHHRNIVPFYGIYYMDDARRRICLVSPWMQNGNLVQYLRNNESTIRTPFIHDIAAGLDYLHSQDLIHGDLKGVNVLVNDKGIACITDFGLSLVRTGKTLAYTSSATGAHGFSHHWAAPELLDEDKTATPASDVWALGCVFYEVLTGKPPFYGLSEAQTIRKLIIGIMPLRPGPSDLKTFEGVDAIWALIQRCWAIVPHQRPTSREILEALVSQGLTRRDGARSVEDDIDFGKLRFEEAMRKTQELPIDYTAVEEILDAISDGGDPDLDMEFNANESPVTPVSEVYDTSTPVDSNESSPSPPAGMDVLMPELQKSGFVNPTHIQFWLGLPSQAYLSHGDHHLLEYPFSDPEPLINGATEF